jgi:hypothetical protein
MAEYLPKVTKEWCKDQLAALGWHDGDIDPTEYIPAVQMRTHELAYRQLRRKLQDYFDSGATLPETSPPYGGVNWKPDVDPVVKDVYNGVAKEQDYREETIFVNDGEDNNACSADFDEEPLEVV